MMQMLMNLSPFKSAQEQPKQDKPVQHGHMFDALQFYEALEGYKSSIINTELGENNNATQNLMLSQTASKSNPEETKSLSKNLVDSDEIVKLTDKQKFISEQVPNKMNYSIDIDSSRVYGGRFTSKGNIYY